MSECAVKYCAGVQVAVAFMLELHVLEKEYIYAVKFQLHVVKRRWLKPSGVVSFKCGKNCLGGEK